MGMKSKYLWLGLIILVAVALRAYKIGQVPLGYAFDEASIAYNAWSISIWHRDEFANFMPWSFRSFGDHKPPLVIYSLAILYKIFGLQLSLVRVLSAVSGVGSVLVVFFIARALANPQSLNYLPWLDKAKPFRKWLPISAGLLLAVSSWAVTLSRVGYEQNTAFFLVNLGILFLLSTKQKPVFWLISAVTFGLSMYAFHTAKIFVPVIVLGYILIERKTLKRSWPWMAVALILGMLLIMPLVIDTILGPGGSRAGTLIINSPNYLKTLLTNIWAYASPRFWLGGFDAVSIRHAIPGAGVLYVIEYFYLILGLALLVSKRREKGAQFLLLWFIAGLLPGILTLGSPHALRTLFTAASEVIIASLGFIETLKYFSGKSFALSRIVGAVSLGLLLINTIFYLKTYYGPYARESATAFQYGYLEAIGRVNQLKSGGDKVVMTDGYGQPYIYCLLYNQIPPQQFLWGALNDYEFRPIKWPESSLNQIYIGLPSEIPPGDPRVVEIIKVPGTDQVALVVAKT